MTPSSFVSNSATYSNPISPEQQTDFGEDDKPNLAIPFTAHEEAFTKTAFAVNGTRTILWPGGSISYLGGNKGMFFANVAKYNVWGNASGDEYNTLVTVSADESGPSFDRTLEQAFYADGPLWGSFGTAASDVDGILAFASTQGGVKVAKVDPENYADLSKYTYWNGNEWVPDAPSIADSASAIIPGLNPTSGDFFWSNLYRTWMFVYMGTTNVFSYRYALGSVTRGAFDITGPWSDEFELYDTTLQTPANGDIYGYAGHAYSGYDPTGRSIILSWSHGVDYEYMAKVEFY
ncbi:MAG: hypothetical protein M1821_003283 [Bathelium mastoideum]|nr:MAG: hypothetical protein M1821_003283 [Bathelium mastoideum]KAI9689359.1 MAG: hypothetical protein M1822_010010 [Bathelium mastoideum]